MNKLHTFVQTAPKPTTVFESLVMTLALVATAEDLRDFAEAEKMAFECAELLTDEEVSLRPQSQVRYKARLLRFFCIYWHVGNFSDFSVGLRGVRVVISHETSMTWLLAPAPSIGGG